MSNLFIYLEASNRTLLFYFLYLSSQKLYIMRVGAHIVGPVSHKVGVL